MLVRRALRSLLPQARTFLWASSRKRSTVDPMIDVHTLQSMFKSGQRNVRLVDSCWYMPNDPRNAQSDYFKETIPGYATSP